MKIIGRFIVISLLASVMRNAYCEEIVSPVNWENDVPQESTYDMPMKGAMRFGLTAGSALGIDVSILLPTSNESLSAVLGFAGESDFSFRKASLLAGAIRRSADRKTAAEFMMGFYEASEATLVSGVGGCGFSSYPPESGSCSSSKKSTASKTNESGLSIRTNLYYAITDSRKILGVIGIVANKSFEGRSPRAFGAYEGYIGLKWLLGAV